MITLLKILGLILLAVMALKMAPVVLGILGAVMSFVLSAGAILVGLATAGGFIFVTLLTIMAPLWVPILLFVGLVALICRLVRGPSTA